LLRIEVAETGTYETNPITKLAVLQMTALRDVGKRTSAQLLLTKKDERNKTAHGGQGAEN